MMKSTRRTFFAAIGAAVLGKYAVKFWPELVAHTSVDTLPLWEPAVPNVGLFGLQYYQVIGNTGMYLGIPRSFSPRMNATITNIGVPGRRMPVRFDPARLPA